MSQAEVLPAPWDIFFSAPQVARFPSCAVKVDLDTGSAWRNPVNTRLCRAPPLLCMSRRGMADSSGDHKVLRLNLCRSAARHLGAAHLLPQATLHTGPRRQVPLLASAASSFQPHLRLCVHYGLQIVHAAGNRREPAGMSWGC